MKIINIMTRNPVIIRSNHRLREALEVMEQNEFHHLPVLSADDHLVGIITARDCRLALHLPDVVQKYWQGEELVDHLLVNSAMTTAPIIVEPETLVVEAARMVLTHYVSCLPVMRGETLIGIVTISDILIAFVKMYQSTIGRITGIFLRALYTLLGGFQLTGSLGCLRVPVNEDVG